MTAAFQLITTTFLQLSLLCIQIDYRCLAWSTVRKCPISFRVASQRQESRCSLFVTRLFNRHKPHDDLKSGKSLEQSKKDLYDQLKNIPRNRPTGPKETNFILSLVRQLEDSCPTADDDVLSQLAGNWELVWTSVDPNSSERQRFLPQNWIK